MCLLEQSFIATTMW